jgi:alpha-amylase/alpha-mannosidase (GH57 family)
MRITITKWRLEPRNADDFRTILLLISTDLPEIEEMLVTINLSGSLITQIGDYVNAQYDSIDFQKQLGRLAAALFAKELKMNPKQIHNPVLKFGYLTETFPYGAVEIPDIADPKNWEFTI